MTQPNSLVAVSSGAVASPVNCVLQSCLLLLNMIYFEGQIIRPLILWLMLRSI